MGLYGKTFDNSNKNLNSNSKLYGKTFEPKPEIMQTESPTFVPTANVPNIDVPKIEVPTVKNEVVAANPVTTSPITAPAAPNGTTYKPDVPVMSNDKLGRISQLEQKKKLLLTPAEQTELNNLYAEKSNIEKDAERVRNAAITQYTPTTGDNINSFLNDADLKAKEFLYSMGAAGGGKEVKRLFDMATGDTKPMYEYSAADDVEEYFTKNYQNFKDAGYSDNQIEEEKKKALSQAKGQDEFTLNRKMLGQKLDWTPTTADRITNIAGTIAGDMVKWTLFGKALGPITGGIESATLRKITERSIMGAATEIDDAFANNRAVDPVNIVRGIVGFNAGGAVADKFEKYGLKFLNKMPDAVKNSLSADIALKLGRGAAFATGNLGSTYFTYPEGQKPTTADYLMNIVTASLYETIPGIADGFKMKGEGADFLNSFGKSFYDNVKQNYKTAQATADINQKGEILDGISKSIDNFTEALNKGRFVGNNERVQETKKVLDLMKYSIAAERTNLGSQGMPEGAAAETANTAPKDPIVRIAGLGEVPVTQDLGDAVVIKAADGNEYPVRKSILSEADFETLPMERPALNAPMKRIQNTNVLPSGNEAIPVEGTKALSAPQIKNRTQDINILPKGENPIELSAGQAEPSKISSIQSEKTLGSTIEPPKLNKPLKSNKSDMEGQEIAFNDEKGRMNGGTIVKQHDKNLFEVQYDNENGTVFGLVRKKNNKYEFVQSKATPKEQIPMSQRTTDNVGARNIKSYEFLHPELKSHIQSEANVLLGELDRTIPAQRAAITNKYGEVATANNRRITTQDIASLKGLGASYSEIRKGLEAIIKDHGAENFALAKKIEVLIDDRLSKGYHDDVTGTEIPKNDEYIRIKNQIEGNSNSGKSKDLGIAKAEIAAGKNKGDGKIEEAKKNASKAVQAVKETEAGNNISSMGGKNNYVKGLKGLAFNRQLIKTGKVDLVGQVVNTPKDVAAIAQVFRDPRFETFRIIYTKGNVIVGHEGVTSRVPASVVVRTKNTMAEQFKDVRAKMAALQADGYYIMHNHPSGDPSPSDADINSTMQYKYNVDGLKGHVIINSNRFAFIERNGLLRTEDLRLQDKPYNEFANTLMKKYGFKNEEELLQNEDKLNQDEHEKFTDLLDQQFYGWNDPLLTPEIDHPLLNVHIDGAETLAKITKTMQLNKNTAVILFLTPKLKIRAIQEVPENLFKDAEEAKNYLMDRSREFGAFTSIIVKGENTDYDNNLKDFFKRDYVTDVITNAGDSWREKGINPEYSQRERGTFFDNEIKGQRVEESSEDYKTSLWKKGPSFAEIKQKFPSLFEASPDAETDKRHPTQIATTTSTYKQVYDFLKGENFKGDILDASSGLGLGTQAGKDMGMKVDDVEPFPDKNYHPKYTSYADINKKYDVVISNAVLNVIPQDFRDGVVKEIGRVMKPGGRAFIMTRGKDVLSSTGKQAIDADNWEYFIPGKNSYQKGFTPKELQSYIEDILGKGYSVEVMNKKNSPFSGKPGVVVTRNAADTVNEPSSTYWTSDRKGTKGISEHEGRVGKVVGNDRYIHKSALDVVPEKYQELIKKAEQHIPSNFNYEVIRYNTKDNSVSFMASPDFNTSHEPIVSDSYRVNEDGTVKFTKEKSSPQIYHHKWQMVKDDYKGFNVKESMSRSEQWKNAIPQTKEMLSKIGYKDYWEKNIIPQLSNGMKNNFVKENFNAIEGSDKGISIPYVRNTQSSPKMPNDEYAQSIEPAGEYMSHDTLNGKFKIPGWEYGHITFKNPLIVDFESTGHGGWKTKLSQRFGGKKGKALSDAIKKAGYDAVVTKNEDGSYNEIVNLSGVKGDLVRENTEPYKVTETPQFKKWFGDSKVVDAEGKPLVVYHGSTKDFTEFKTSNAPGWGEGIYFSDNPDAVTYYAEGKGGNVKPVYLKIENPFDGSYPGDKAIKGTETYKKYLAKERQKAIDNYEYDPEYDDEFSIDPETYWQEDGNFANGVIRDLGYDGIIAENSNDIDGKEIVVFSPNQIKSATGNSGEFNPEDNSILREDAAEYKTTDKKYIDRAIEKWGTTEDFNKASFMLPDGTMLDFSHGSDERYLNHHFIEEILPYSMKEFIKEGNIRINQRSGIEVGAVPTKEQWTKLQPYLEKMFNQNKDYLVVDLIKPNGTHTTEAYFDTLNTDKVYDDIKNFYKTGKTSRERSKVSEFVMEDNAEYQTIEKEAVKHFGTTANFKEAGYLTTSGKLLDFSGKRQGGQPGNRSMDHREISDMNNYEGPSMEKFMDMGNIRMKPEMNGFELTQPPTKQQIAVLKRYIDRAYGEVIVDLGYIDNHRTTPHYLEYNEGTKTSKILADIERFYEPIKENPDIKLRDLIDIYDTKYSKSEIQDFLRESTSEYKAKNETIKSVDKKIEAIRRQMDLIPEALKKQAEEQLKKYELIRSEMKKKKVAALTKNQIDTLMKKANIELPKFKAKYAADMKASQAEHKEDLKDLKDFERYKADERVKAIKANYENKIAEIKAKHAAAVERMKRDKNLNTDFIQYLDKKKLNEELSEAKKKAEAEIFSLKERLDKKIFNEKIKGYRNLEAYKARVERQRQKEAYEKMWKEKEAKERAAAQEKLSKEKKFLKKVMKNIKYMRPEYQAKVKELLADIQLTKPTEQTLNRLKAMQEFFDREENQDIIIPKRVQRLLDRLDKRPWVELDDSEKEDILKAVQAYVSLNDLKQQLIINGRRKAEKEAVNEAVDNLMNKPVKYNVAQDMIDLSARLEKLKPSIFKRIFTVGAFEPELMTQMLDNKVGNVIEDNNGIITKLMHKELLKGENVKLRYIYKAMDELLKTIKDNKIKVDDWSEEFNKKKKRVDYVTVKLESGKPLKLSKGQRIWFYVNSFNKDNIDHIVTGGVSRRDAKEYIYEFTYGDIKRIVDSVTKEEKIIGDKILELLNREESGDIKEGLNRVSTLLNGYPIATVENYFPLSTNSLDRKMDPAKTQQDFVRQTIEGNGHLKERSGGKNAILIDDIFEAFVRSIEQSASYIGLANPIRNAKALLYNNKFRIELIKRYGENYYKVLDNMIKDVESKAMDISDVGKFAMGFLNKIQVSILGANLFIPLKQPVAYINAMTEIEPKYLRKALLKRPNWEEIKKYSPSLRYRAEGNNDREIGEIGAVGKLRADFTGKTTLASKMTIGIEKMDLLEIGRIWEAAKLEVKDKLPNLTGDAYFEKVAERADEIINRHQPSTFAENRSETGRSKDPWTRLGTTFSSQANKVYNQVGREFLRYQTSNKTVKDKARLVHNLTWILIVTSMIIAGIDNYFKNFMFGRQSKSLTDMGNSIVSSLVGNVYFIGPAYNSLQSKIVKGTFQGSDISNPLSSFGGEVIDAMVNTYNTAQDLITNAKYKSGENEGKSKFANEVQSAAANLLEVILKGKGIPAKNIENLFNIPASFIPGTAANDNRNKNKVLDEIEEYKAELSDIEAELSNKKTPAGRKAYLNSRKAALSKLIKNVYTKNNLEVPKIYQDKK